MKIETKYGIIDVDLDTVSLKDVCKIISEISVDADVSNNAPTVLYSGILSNYSTNKIVKSMNIIKIRINIVFLLLKPIGKLF